MLCSHSWEGGVNKKRNISGDARGLPASPNTSRKCGKGVRRANQKSRCKYLPCTRPCLEAFLYVNSIYYVVMICMFITTTLREKCYHYCHSVMKEQSGRAPRPAQGHTAANWRMLLPSTQARASHSLTLLTPSPAEGRLCASTDVAHTSVRFATSCFCPTINRWDYSVLVLWPL